MRQRIGEEADKRLGLYLPLSAEQQQEQQKLPKRMFEIPPRPLLPEGLVDTPLVRVFNFLSE
jgi:mediator of RNA polymerase II transcription subunit 14